MKTWLLALGCLSGTVLYAGDDYFSPEDWNLLKNDRERLLKYKTLTPKEWQLIWEQMDPLEQERMEKVIKERNHKKVFDYQINETYKNHPKSRIAKWRKLSNEQKESYFALYKKEDQLEIWKTLDSDLKLRCYRHLPVHIQDRFLDEILEIWKALEGHQRSCYFRCLSSLGEKLFSDLDEVTQEQYLSGHHKASKVRF